MIRNVYTDGSCREQQMAAGVYVLPADGFAEALHLSIRVRGTGNASMAEQAALLIGIQVAAQATAGIVHCDDRVLVEAVNGRACKGAFGARVATLRRELAEAPHVAVQWVQGHGTDLGNRRADRLAREGLPPMGYQSPHGVIVMDPVEPTYQTGYCARPPRPRPVRPSCAECGVRATWESVRFGMPHTVERWLCVACLFATRQNAARGTRPPT